MADHKYEGVLIVDKEQGPTSHDVVAALRRITGVRRIGHCGTLDPLATGVLVVCLGRFTRLNEWLSAGEKGYEATFFLGATSDTLDGWGTITPQPVVEVPEFDTLNAHLQAFKGTIEQIPPAFSALKVNGIRSYKLARRHQSVPLPLRRVHIAELEVIEYGFPLLKLRAVCSRGTYVRSLAADLGTALGCGAYVQALRRYRVGDLDLSVALSLGKIQARMDQGHLDRCFVPPPKALNQLAEVVLEPGDLRRFVHGNPVALSGQVEVPQGGVCAVYDRDMRLSGVGKWDLEKGRLRPLRVLCDPEVLSGVGVVDGKKEQCG